MSLQEEGYAAPPVSSASPRPPVGLLAGGGRFPFVFAEKARSVGIPVVCVGLRGSADPELAKYVDKFYWSFPARVGGIMRRFKRAGVQSLVMAGKVHKADILHKPWKVLTLFPDLRMVHLWCFRPRPDNRDDSLMLALIEEFADDGLKVESALDLCPELLVRPGQLTRRAPTAREEKDIAFGWELAREMGRLDVGQSVAVKEMAVLAVEAMEGTDRTILRAGDLCRNGGFVVVKVAKPAQDMRFDVPTIGVATVENLHKAGGRVLAIEAGRTIVIDQAETVALADRYGLTIVARSAA
jgi:UDP-2,3-diacylglucosamine hydrolase